MNLASEIRASFAKIIDRYQHDHDALASMRVSHIRAVENHIDALEDRVARCTCQQEQAFEPRERDDSKHTARMFARFATAEADYQRACAKLRRAI
jgi:hypothetical protein